MCGSQAKDWAYDYRDPKVQYDPVKQAPYSLDVEKHYIPLCGSCHKRFDNCQRARDVISKDAIMQNQQRAVEVMMARIEVLEAALVAHGVEV